MAFRGDLVRPSGVSRLVDPAVAVAPPRLEEGKRTADGDPGPGGMGPGSRP